jgi:glycine dehydrogenase subunit 1
MFPGEACFKEFAILLPKPAPTVRDAMVERGYLAGVPAPGNAHGLIVAVTERRTRGEIDGFVEAMGEVLAA